MARTVLVHQKKYSEPKILIGRSAYVHTIPTYAVLDVDLVLLVARERGAEEGEDALATRVVVFELIPIREVGAAISSAEEQSHRTDRFSADACHLAVFDHGTERRDAGPEADHDTRERVRVWDCDSGRVHLPGNEIRRGTERESGQVAGAETVALLPRRRHPVVLDDAEMDAVLVHFVRRRN